MTFDEETEAESNTQYGFHGRATMWRRNSPSHGFFGIWPSSGSTESFICAYYLVLFLTLAARNCYLTAVPMNCLASLLLNFDILCCTTHNILIEQSTPASPTNLCERAKTKHQLCIGPHLDPLSSRAALQFTIQFGATRYESR